MRSLQVTLYTNEGLILGTEQGGITKAYELLELNKKTAVAAKVSEVLDFGPGIHQQQIDLTFITQEDLEEAKHNGTITFQKEDNTL